ncbi:MAG: MBL fold metallo-hydrolase [Burkholderiaceae bacterium]|nr:MBL fold metallo-hydrolase [Burkholderiaceae bacterium]
MRFASLGSGSEGNALLVEGADGASCVLIDCGFGLREAERRLRALGREPAQIDAILVTHEHGDHVGGVFRLAHRHRIPVHLTHGTARAIGSLVPDSFDRAALLRVFDSSAGFECAGLRVDPVAVPHDAREPVQYVLDDGSVRLGVLTDLGHGSAHVVRALSRLDALVLECNHDPGLLEANRRYTAALKRRIGGQWGHLSNIEAARILAAVDRSRLRIVVAAHLSRQNNRPDLARAALACVFDDDPQALQVADQDSGIGWIAV